MKEMIRRLDDASRRDFATYLARACLGVAIAPTFSIGRAMAASPASGGGKAKHLIYLYMSGGMTHLDTFDPKPGAETQGPVESIDTNVPGIRVSQYLARTAKLMDKIAVVNGMHTTTGAHEQGRYYMRTSYTMRGTIKHPAIGSWLLRMQGSGNKVLPGYVMIGGGSNESTPGFLENRYAPLPLGSATGGLPYSTPNVPYAQFEDRLTLADAFDKSFRKKYQQKQVRAYTNLYHDAIQLMNSKELAVFDLSKEPQNLRQEYGENNFGQGCLLARRLVENDVKCVEVHMGGWDTHNDNFDRIEDLVPTLDRGLSALIADLDRRGLLSKTLVVLATEFGRTPLINVNRGRDHHPAAFSCLLAGAGVKTGQKYGKTDNKGVAVADNGVTIPDFNATIGKALGLPLAEVIKSPSGRPFTFADKGKPVDALV